MMRRMSAYTAKLMIIVHVPSGDIGVSEKQERNARVVAAPSGTIKTKRRGNVR
jgi:hypothetical protein